MAVCLKGGIAMPSPFPGMDPFIEGQVWEDFHHRFIDEIAVAITPSLRPRYVARVEVQVYLEHEAEERRSIVPERQPYVPCGFV
jgi:hypothetical protein